MEVRKDVACAWRGSGGGESVVEGRFEGGVDGEDVGYAMGIELRGEGVRRQGEGEERKNKAVESCMEGSRECQLGFLGRLMYGPGRRVDFFAEEGSHHSCSEKIPLNINNMRQLLRMCLSRYAC